MAVICSQPRCPQPAVARGRCVLHRMTEEQRGYGREWRRLRAVVRGPSCENCGASRDLTVDHILPRSLGGTNERSNLRTLCRSCHASIGVKSGRAL